jgi:hypothetical protein
MKEGAGNYVKDGEHNYIGGFIWHLAAVHENICQR